MGFPGRQGDLIRQVSEDGSVLAKGGPGSWKAGLITKGHPGGNLSESVVLRELSSPWTMEYFYTGSVIDCLPWRAVNS